MNICLSHGGQSIYESSQPSDRLLVATVEGVAILERGSGGNWKEADRWLAEYHVVGLAHVPEAALLVATMHDGGLRVSEDGGRHWEQRTHGIPSQNVYCVAHAVNGDRIRLFAGTEPAHLYASDDLGRHWRELSSLRDVPSVPKWTFPAPPHDAHVINVTVHQDDPDIIYACVEQGGLFKSTDGGESWRELQGFNDDVHRVLIPKTKPDRLFLPTGYGFYRSDDAGETWVDLADRIEPVRYPDPMVIDPLKDDVMFITGGDADPYHWMQSKSANPRVLRSRDGGKTWKVVDRGMPARLDASFEAMAIEAWPGGSAVYLGNTDGEIWMTDDEGESWSRIATEVGPVSKTIHHTILRQDLSFEKHQRPAV